MVYKIGVANYKKLLSKNKHNQFKFVNEKFQRLHKFQFRSLEKLKINKIQGNFKSNKLFIKQNNLLNKKRNKLQQHLSKR